MNRLANLSPLPSLSRIRAWGLPAVLLAWCSILAFVLLLWELPRIDALETRLNQLNRLQSVTERERAALAAVIGRADQLRSQAALLDSAGLFTRPDRWALAGRIEAARRQSGIESVEFQISTEQIDPTGGSGGRRLARTPLHLRIVSADAAGASTFLAMLWQDGPRPIEMTGLVQSQLPGARGAPPRLSTEVSYDWYTLIEGS